MKIAVVGAGRVASCMVPALKEAGHTISAVYSRTQESARTLATQVGAVWTTDLATLPQGADVCISMLSDSALVQLVPQIVSALGLDTLFLHTAGSVSMDLWQQAGAVNYGVLYPMQTFSKGKRIEWGSVPLFIEAVPGCMAQVRTLAESLGGNVKELSSRDRCRLHVCAVFACNFTNRMYAISEYLLAEMGVPFSVMHPLIEETCGKALAMSPSLGQTGPAVRGDLDVIQKHIEMLSDHSGWAELYRVISAEIMDKYKAKQ